MSRRKLPERAGVLRRGRPGFFHFDAHSRGSPACAAAFAAGRRWREDWRPCAACPWGPAPSARGSAGRSRRTVPRACSCAATPPAASDGRGCRAYPQAAPGGTARTLRPCGHRLPSARSSPWGCAARSSASAAGSACRSSRASCWMRRISRTHSSIVAAIFWCMSLGIVALRRSAASSRSP